MITLQSLAALAVRFIGLGLLLYTVPQLFFSLASATLGDSSGTPTLSVALRPFGLLFLQPTVALLLMLYARLIGRWIALGLD
jgi:hypothetical protein